MILHYLLYRDQLYLLIFSIFININVIDLKCNLDLTRYLCYVCVTNNLFYVLNVQLDDWVLCRIYKKNSGGQKPAGSGMQSKEYSHASSSSCSSQYEDMLESIPEMDDRFFTLPGMSSKNFQQEDQKPINLQQLGSGNFDWATLAGLTPLPELSQGQQVPAQQMDTNMNGANDMYAPVFPQVGTSSNNKNLADEEVQSGIRNQQRMENAGYFRQNMNAFVPTMSNSTDPFGVRYPTHQGGTLGFRQ